MPLLLKLSGINSEFTLWFSWRFLLWWWMTNQWHSLVGPAADSLTHRNTRNIQSCWKWRKSMRNGHFKRKCATDTSNTKLTTLLPRHISYHIKSTLTLCLVPVARLVLVLRWSAILFRWSGCARVRWRCARLDSSGAPRDSCGPWGDTLKGAGKCRRRESFGGNNEMWNIIAMLIERGLCPLLWFMVYFAFATETGGNIFPGNIFPQITAKII